MSISKLAETQSTFKQAFTESIPDQATIDIIFVILKWESSITVAIQFLINNNNNNSKNIFKYIKTVKPIILNTSTCDLS